jgi:hypothetical protein
MADTYTVYNFPDHERGTTFGGVSFELLVNGVPKSLAGAKIEMAIAGKVFSTVTGELIITDAAGGKFEFKKQIVTLSPKNHHYEITYTFSDGEVKTYIEGYWQING